MNAEQEIKKLKIMIELKEHIIDSLVRESEVKTKEINLMKTELKAKDDKIMELTKTTFTHTQLGTRNAELKLQNQALRTELIEAKQNNLEFVKELDQVKANFASDKQTLTNTHSLIIGKQRLDIIKVQNNYETLIVELESQIRFNEQRIQGAKDRIKRFLKEFDRKMLGALNRIRENLKQEGSKWEPDRRLKKLQRAVDYNMSKLRKELDAENIGTLDTEDDDLVKDEMEEEGSDNGAGLIEEFDNEEVSGDEIEKEGPDNGEGSNEEFDNEEVSGDEMEKEGSQNGESPTMSKGVKDRV